MSSFLVSDIVDNLHKLRSKAEYIQDIALDLIMKDDEGTLRRINSGDLEGFVNTLEDMLVYLNEWAGTAEE
jgi:hypothetical protein